MSFNLKENEIIQFEEKTTDLYNVDKLFGLKMLSKARGKFTLTNKKIIFEYSWSDEVFEIEISNISKIEKCFIGFPLIGTDKMFPIFPIGIDILLTNGEKYKIALNFSRNKIYDILLNEMK